MTGRRNIKVLPTWSRLGDWSEACVFLFLFWLYVAAIAGSAAIRAELGAVRAEVAYRDALDLRAEQAQSARIVATIPPNLVAANPAELARIMATRGTNLNQYADLLLNLDLFGLERGDLVDLVRIDGPFALVAVRSGRHAGRSGWVESDRLAPAPLLYPDFE